MDSDLWLSSVLISLMRFPCLLLWRAVLVSTPTFYLSYPVFIVDSHTRGLLMFQTPDDAKLMAWSDGVH